MLARGPDSRRLVVAQRLVVPVVGLTDLDPQQHASGFNCISPPSHRSGPSDLPHTSAIYPPIASPPGSQPPAPAGPGRAAARHPWPWSTRWCRRPGTRWAAAESRVGLLERMVADRDSVSAGDIEAVRAPAPTLRSWTPC